MSASADYKEFLEVVLTEVQEDEVFSPGRPIPRWSALHGSASMRLLRKAASNEQRRAVLLQLLGVVDSNVEVTGINAGLKMKRYADKEN